ncbi:MAG TPA: PEFG-CTERM sorting domain-containing protein, partial [Candidatus Acidoferrales bacterium]|nr:PEFG-CTERM sorting domain-containing protein [Candidatus Acidoferrales bacterium]
IWVPTGATTIGANSHLIGTVSGAPITIGANSDINGMGPANIMADAISAVPEFGTIAALILLVAIVSVIAISAKTGLCGMPKY